MLIWWIIGYLVVGYIAANVSWYLHRRDEHIKEKQKIAKSKGLEPAAYAVISVWLYAFLLPIGVLADMVELGMYLYKKLRI